MRKDIIKDVEIIEPPLEEITKKYSTFSSIKRSCIGGCGCLLLLIIILAIGLKIVLGVGPQKISSLPVGFPSDITIYDKENIDSITYINGEYKNRTIEIAAVIPKIILSPLISAVEEDETSNKDESQLENIWKIVNSPVSDKRHVLKIRWINMPADPTFVYNYYTTELKHANYIISSSSTTKTEKQLNFKKDQVSGSLFVKVDSELSGTPVANLIVNYFSSSTPD